MPSTISLEADSHCIGEPTILYFGTPVVLISTLNADGSANLAPMSSAFWLGWRGFLGLDASSKTTENLIARRQCVLNLPSERQVDAVDRLALTTGCESVPPHKVARGYRYEQDKFEIAGLTRGHSQTVAPWRAQECPVQMEAVVEHIYKAGESDPNLRGRRILFEVRVMRVHLAKDILLDSNPDRVDPDRWRPLIMNFQKFYGLTAGQLHSSRLSQISEALYRGTDIDRARREPEGRRYTG
jgi:flavin reductase (DIM6/NTAB) family NADH-FMN oxidoreductase RutF